MAGQDMFGRETSLGGAMAAENTFLSFATVPGITAGSSGFIIQQFQLQYAQNITRLYALEDPKVYFVAGRTEGQFTIQNVVGPNDLIGPFLKAYGNVCNIGGAFSLTADASCTSGQQAVTGGLQLGVNNPVISSFGLSMQAGNMVIATTLQGMFTSLDLF